MSRFWLITSLFGLALFTWFVPNSRAAEDSADGRGYLLHVSKGQIPNDTGSDKTKLSIIEKSELGGKALQVDFLPDDSFGDRVAKIDNWKPYTHLQFEALNPTDKTVKLVFNVAHRRTTSFQTRGAVELKLPPGKHAFDIGIDEITNVNGSAPDLSKVTKWYVAIEDSGSPTLFFGDIYLSGKAAEATAQPTAAGGPATAYSIKGKIGGQDVDLVATPLIAQTANLGAATAAPKANVKVAGDPDRVARIHAAKMPKIDKPIAMGTPEADAIVSALEVYPPDNPWNLIVSDWPVSPDSKAMIASIGPNKVFRYNADMTYVIIPPNQPKVPVTLGEYSGESDLGPYPVPDITPIEGWPGNYLSRNKKVTLDDVQRDVLKEGGDRHAIVLDPTNRMLYEFYAMKKTDKGWTAAGAATFDLKSNKLRPDGWTSTDAAGLPLYPAIVRYDELQRGVIDHPLRVTITRSRKSYVYPATHHAGHGTADSLPRMGERLRLRADFDISSFSPPMKTILTALKRYGMLVADNGIDWAVSISPDPRIGNMTEEFRKVKGSDFEVINPPPGYQPAE